MLNFLQAGLIGANLAAHVLLPHIVDGSRWDFVCGSLALSDMPHCKAGVARAQFHSMSLILSGGFLILVVLAATALPITAWARNYAESAKRGFAGGFVPAMILVLALTVSTMVWPNIVPTFRGTPGPVFTMLNSAALLVLAYLLTTYIRVGLSSRREET